MKCNQADDLLIDYLYQELDPEQMERFESHLRDCPSCTQEIDGFEQTRSLFRELPEEDPPARLSALLLQEASRAAARTPDRFWERVRRSLRMVVMHPAMTAAVTLVLVLGVSFYVYRQAPGRLDAPAESAVDLPLLDERPLPQAPTATIGVGEADPGRAGEAQTLENLKAVKNEQIATETDNLVKENKSSDFDNSLNSAVARGLGARSGEALEPAPEPVASAPADEEQAGGTIRRDVAKGAGSAPAGPARRADKAAMDDLDSPAVLAQLEGEVQKTAVETKAKTAQTARPSRARSTGSLGQNMADWSSPSARPAESANGQSAAAPASSERALQTQVAQAPKKKPSTESRLSTQAEDGDSGGQQAAGPRGKDALAEGLSLLLERGDKAADAGRCMQAFDYYNQALALDSTIRPRITPRVQTCASRLGQDDEQQLVVAQKQYPRLSSLLQSQVMASRRARIAREAQPARAQQRAVEQRQTDQKQGGKVVQQKGAADAYQNTAY